MLFLRNSWSDNCRAIWEFESIFHTSSIFGFLAIAYNQYFWRIFSNSRMLAMYKKKKRTINDFANLSAIFYLFSGVLLFLIRGLSSETSNKVICLEF